MTIGIDASRSVSTIQKTGVEKVSDELLRQFVKFKIQNSKFKIIFYTPQQISWLPKENQRILKWPFRFFWTQIRLAWELLIHPPQVMFFPVHAMPLLLLITYYLLRITDYYKIIHDIAFKKQPRVYSLQQKIILNLDLWLAKKLCTKIFVPSYAVKDDLIKYARLARERIVVTPWGYNSKNFKFSIFNFQINSKYQIPNPKINENNYGLRITDYGLRKKQILYIGRVEEKKNISNLIKAFEIFHEKYPDYKLILAGKIDKKFPISNFKFPNKSQTSNSKLQNNHSVTNYGLRITDYKNIEFLSYISEEKKYQLLAESAALIHVPREEGFCFPMLEAFDFGLPVVASDIPVLREIGADGCVYVNPDLPEIIAKGLEIAVETRHASSLQIEKSRERLKEFDWQKTAETILREILAA